MGTTDLSSMSDDELFAKLPPRKSNPSTPAPASPPVAPIASATTTQPDVSKMSDDELFAALPSRAPAQSNSPPPYGGVPAALNASTTEQPKPERSLMDGLGRQVGLTARHAVNGLAAIPAALSDGITAPINAGLNKVMGEGNGFRFQKAGEALNKVMTAGGLPTPENATERVVGEAATALTGVGGTMAVGNALSSVGGPLSRAVGSMLTANPGTQAVSAVTGAGASGVTRESGGGAGAQMVAGIAGSLAPTIGPYAAQEGVRRMIRGDEDGRQRMVSNIKTFQDASGTMPSVGQAIESRVTQGIESGLSKIPGGAGVMSRFAQKQSDSLQENVQRLTNELAPDASAANAGEAIQRGVDAFKKGFRAQQTQFYAELDNHLPLATPITSDRTRAALADLNSDIAGAPELSKWFKNARIQGIDGGLKSDTSSLEAVLSRPGMRQQFTQMKDQLEAEAVRATAINNERRTLGMRNLEPVSTPAQIQDQLDGFLTKQVDSRLPYESIKKLRTLVGKEIEDNSLVSDVPRSKWRSLYSALSDDLGAAAEAAGPKAHESWVRANEFTKIHMDRLDELSSIVKRDSPEKVFQAAMSGSSEGNTIVNRVMTALPVEERRQVAASVLQKMGNARPGGQNEMNNAFSSETFLTNLARLNPEARKSLFDSLDIADVGKRVNTMGKMASNIRQGSKVFSNPSGTAQAGAQIAGMGALISGNPVAIGTAVATGAGANMLARMATNPKFVTKLAGKTALDPAVMPAGFNAAAHAAYADEKRKREQEQTPRLGAIPKR